MDNEIIIESELEEDTAACETLLRRVIPAALEAEGVGAPCEVDVLLTNDEGIRRINLEQRDVDRATDVLSFPMFEYVPGRPPEGAADADPETGLIPLGDMVISLERAAPREGSTATGLSGGWPIWPFTPCSICWATTTWTTAPRRPGCGSGRRPSWALWAYPGGRCDEARRVPYPAGTPILSGKLCEAGWGAVRGRRAPAQLGALHCK